ncbi:DUF3857 domain-containing protein [Novosphingobium humi]|uniref:DUF3857 domain-containing protein n=1 Tax=Novosphingobium humi TaxID=2282397 RepID=UPI0025B26EC8|nr:DUF3857 domain-containing protein [Novosphingobium humi]WJS97446.1 DUF3857 domain-containing protein [Novosphingobium humi]
MNKGLPFLALMAVLAGPLRADELPRADVAPAWVVPVAMPTTLQPAGAAPLHMVMQDQQVWFHGGTTSFYQRRILRIDQPEGIQGMARLSVQWRPETDRLTIHAFRLTRGNRTNDLLPSVQEVLAHKGSNLGGLRVDGQRSLGLPIAGMAVGDVIEIAWTIDRTEPLLGGHHEVSLDAGSYGVIDRLALAARWDGARPMGVAAENLPAALERGPGRVAMVTDALAESKAARVLELSDFAQWADVAGVFAPLFDAARRVGPDSPLRGQIADIRAASGDPLAQAGMALTIARRDVRYLYVGLGQGNLKPMPADQVWLRGFADCKGKAALLLGLLDGLGIKAEAALVATQGGEGMDRRLPSVTGFDHVIVRAQIAGRVYWLDPTAEMEDKEATLNLAAMPVPRYGWALPVRAGAGLEALGSMRNARAQTGGARAKARAPRGT